MAENASSERNGANRNRVTSESDVNSVSPDRASPVSKRAKHDQVAAIMADLDRTHGSVAPKHKGSGKNWLRQRPQVKRPFRIRISLVQVMQ